MTTAPEFTPEMVDIVVPLGTEDDHVTYRTLGETTPTPGLAVSPGIHRNGYCGTWLVSHAGTGRRIPLGEFVNVEAARLFATELGNVPGVDWAACDMPSAAEAFKAPAAVAAFQAALKAARDEDTDWSLG